MQPYNIQYKAMDTTMVLNNLLSLIRSMPLTTSNKEWLADHLYEEVKAEKLKDATAAQSNGWPKVRREDMVITPRVASMFQISETLPEDFDEKKAYGQHLSEKYK